MRYSNVRLSFDAAHCIKCQEISTLCSGPGRALEAVLEAYLRNRRLDVLVDMRHLTIATLF